MRVVDEFAVIRARLVRQGVNLPHNDIWIAATATTRGLALVSCDRHFDAVDGLEHVHLDPKPAG